MDKWTRKYMKLARTLAEDNDACYSRRIGAVLVSEQNRIISVGYNGSIEGAPHTDTPEYLRHLYLNLLSDEQMLDLYRRHGVAECSEFVEQFAGCKTCPRRLLNMSSGQGLEYCNCLSYESRIQLEDGSWRKIGEIVRNREQVRVRTFDTSSGQFVSRPVTNWYENTFDGVWMRVVTKASRYGKHEVLAAKLTPDHQVLTSRGWIAVSELQQGDLVASDEAGLSPVEQEVILGSLMGDGSISLTDESARFYVTHHDGQREYVQWKNSLLARISRGVFTSVRDKRTPNGVVYENCVSHRLITESRKSLVHLFEITHDGALKRLSEAWLDKLTALSLAVWYMDDGSLYSGRHASIAVHSLLSSERERLLSYLSQRWGIIAKEVGDGRLWLNAHSSDKFFAIVSPYIPPCMEYKLPKGERRKPKVDVLDRNKPTIGWDEVVEVQTLPREAASVRTKSYCIDVEGTHNFVTLNCVVHNCAHAEVNTLASANQTGATTLNSTMYIWGERPIGPCHNCAISMVQAKVIRVVCCKGNDYSKSSRGLFQMSGVELVEVDGNEIDAHGS